MITYLKLQPNDYIFFVELIYLFEDVFEMENFKIPQEEHLRKPKISDNPVLDCRHLGWYYGYFHVFLLLPDFLAPLDFMGVGAGASYVVPVFLGIDSGASEGLLVTLTPLEAELGWL